MPCRPNTFTVMATVSVEPLTYEHVHAPSLSRNDPAFEGELVESTSTLPSQHQLDKVFAPRKRTFAAFVSDLAEHASERTTHRVNHLFEGRDACEMLNSVQNSLPSITLPTSRQLGVAFDTVSDSFQTFTSQLSPEPFLSSPDTSDSEAECTAYYFAQEMGWKAQRALVRQQICSDRNVTPIRANLSWQMKLRQALSDTFDSKHDQLQIGGMLDMKPLWIADKEKKLWRLVLESNISEIMAIGDGIDDVLELVGTGFKLVEQPSWCPTGDYTRKTAETEGIKGDSEEEWELVER